MSIIHAKHSPEGIYHTPQASYGLPKGAMVLKVWYIFIDNMVSTEKVMLDHMFSVQLLGGTGIPFQLPQAPALT